MHRSNASLFHHLVGAGAREALTEWLTSVDTGWAIEDPRNPLTHDTSIESDNEASNAELCRDITT